MNDLRNPIIIIYLLEGFKVLTLVSIPPGVIFIFTLEGIEYYNDVDLR